MLGTSRTSLPSGGAGMSNAVETLAGVLLMGADRRTTLRALRAAGRALAAAGAGTATGLVAPPTATVPRGKAAGSWFAGRLCNPAETVFILL